MRIESQQCNWNRQQGNSIALYSPPSAFEPFYLCKGLDIGVATEKLVDACNHQFDIGTKYITCHYLEKVKEKRLTITYKIAP